MWILNFLPFWIFHLLLLVGIIGLVVSFTLRFIPLVSTYQLPLQVISVLLFSVGIYFQGAISNQKEWEAKIREMELKVQLAEEKARSANENIKYKFIDRVKVVTETQVVVQEKIKEVATIIDAQCKMTPEGIELINAAARNSITKTNK